MKPSAILFDLDDTLADRAAALRRYAGSFLADFALDLHALTVDQVHAAFVSSDDFGSMRQASALVSALPWRRPVADRVLFDHWERVFGTRAQFFDDAPPLLEELRRRDIRLGVVTNGGAAMQRAKINALRLDEVMSTIVISSEVGLAKPDPRIFHLALANLGVASADTWFVGDHPELDVRGADKAGLRSFWVRTGAIKCDGPEPALQLSRLAELIRYIDP